MSRLGSPLAAVVAKGREPEPEEARRTAAAAYHNHGIVLIRPEWLVGQCDREKLIGLAEQVHGARRSR